MKFKSNRNQSAVRREKPFVCVGAHLKTATSFLNAWNCSGVGLVTFRIFTATSPATILTPPTYF